MNAFNFDPDKVPYIPDADERTAYFDVLRAAAETPRDELMVAVMRLYAEVIALEKINPEAAERAWRRAAEQLGDAAVDLFRQKLDLWEQQTKGDQP